MSHKRFLNKMRAYFNWWKEKGHTKKFGIRNFRVLAITLNEDRVRARAEITRLADARKTGSFMFWFTDEGIYSLDDPKIILEPIWLTAYKEDKKYHSIIE